jgi:TonB family protein
MEKGIQGQVLLKVLISETGDVTQVDVVRGDPILAKAALAAAKKWKYKPFLKNGKAIPIATQIPFDFAFSDRVENEPPQPDKPEDQKAVSAPADAALKKPAGSDAAPEATSESSSGKQSPELLPHDILQLSAGVVEGHLIHKVVPVYPGEAKRNRIEGTVLLHAVIEKDGRVGELTLISGPKQLIPAAIGAVQQWRYTPYIVKGEAVEIETTITVNFNLH